MSECKIAMGAALERKSRYLLTVDSDISELYYASMLLQRFSYNSCTATNGVDALVMAIAAAPSLIIVDLNLTDMPGLELIQRLKQDVRTAAVPVIVKTIGPAPELELQCRRAGVVSFVHSPVLAEDLYRAVQAATEPTPRMNIRIHTELPVVMNGKPLECAEGECASELSEHGMYVRTRQHCPSNTPVPVQFDIKGRFISAEAQVLYCHHFGQGPFKEPGIGFKFVRIAPEDRAYIRAYIEEEIMRGMLRKRGA
jgi:CheY-like chemotaxis protein